MKTCFGRYLRVPIKKISLDDIVANLPDCAKRKCRRALKPLLEGGYVLGTCPKTDATIEGTVCRVIRDAIDRLRHASDCDNRPGRGPKFPLEAARQWVSEGFKHLARMDYPADPTLLLCSAIGLAALEDIANSDSCQLVRMLLGRPNALRHREDGQLCRVLGLPRVLCDIAQLEADRILDGLMPEGVCWLRLNTGYLVAATSKELRDQAVRILEQSAAQRVGDLTPYTGEDDAPWEIKLNGYWLIKTETGRLDWTINPSAGRRQESCIAEMLHTSEPRPELGRALLKALGSVKAAKAYYAGPDGEVLASNLRSLIDPLKSIWDRWMKEARQ